MSNQKNSRFITYPSVVDAENPIVVIVDADSQDIKRVGLFCKTSLRDYDIWLYRTDLNDKSWISAALDRSIVLLQRAGSTFNAYHKQIKYFGPDMDIKTPVQWFKDNDGGQ